MKQTKGSKPSLKLSEEKIRILEEWVIETQKRGQYLGKAGMASCPFCGFDPYGFIKEIQKLTDEKPANN